MYILVSAVAIATIITMILIKLTDGNDEPWL